MNDKNGGKETFAQLRRHHGATVLTLGILSLATAVSVCGGIVLGIIAWIMGREDLRAMDQQTMNPEGRGMTNAGVICGIIAVSLSSLWLIMLLFRVAFGSHGFQTQKSVQSSCLSNEKQIALGFLMYAQDWDERFPPADRWTMLINPYIKNTQIFKCGNDSSPTLSSYGMNAALSGKLLKDIPDPAGTVLIFETAMPGNSPKGGEGDVANPPRHNGGNNYGYADGHCTWEVQTPKFGP